MSFMVIIDLPKADAARPSAFLLLIGRSGITTPPLPGTVNQCIFDRFGIKEILIARFQVWDSPLLGLGSEPSNWYPQITGHGTRW